MSDSFFRTGAEAGIGTTSKTREATPCAHCGATTMVLTGLDLSESRQCSRCMKAEAECGCDPMTKSSSEEEVRT